MGIWDKSVGILKDKTDSLDDVSKYQKALLKTFSFTGIGGGSGASTILLYIAQYLSIVEKKQVMVLDLNFLQPDLLYNMNVDVTADNSILNYIKGSKTLESCFIEDEQIKNLHLLTASPKDSMMLLMSVKPDDNTIGKILNQLEMFDYVLLNLPYMQPMITFIEPLSHVDKGYIVIDERLSSLKKVHGMLDFIHSFAATSNTFSNIILNKRSKYEYPLEKIESLKCDLITEIPYVNGMVHNTNIKKPLIDTIESKEYQLKLGDIIENLKE